MKKFDWKKITAEFLGTMILVLFGCGVMVFTTDLIVVALAFGLVFVGLMYVMGPVTQLHINPAVSLAMAINRRITWMDMVWRMAAQFLGAIAGAALLFAILRLIPGSSTAYMGQNFFYTEQVPRGASLGGAFLVEAIMTFVFVLVFVAVTAKSKGSTRMAGIIIGLTLVLMYLFGYGLTGASVNPARSLGPAVFSLVALRQVWLFIVAPLVGAVAAAFVGRLIFDTERDVQCITAPQNL